MARQFKRLIYMDNITTHPKKNEISFKRYARTGLFLGFTLNNSSLREEIIKKMLDSDNLYEFKDNSFSYQCYEPYDRDSRESAINRRDEIISSLIEEIIKR